MEARPIRSPDAYDSLRVLGVVFLCISGLWMLLAKYRPGLGVTVLSIEGLFFTVPFLYALFLYSCIVGKGH